LVAAALRRSRRAGVLVGISGLDRLALSRFLRDKGVQVTIVPNAAELAKGLREGRFEFGVTERLLAGQIAARENLTLSWAPDELPRFVYAPTTHHDDIARFTKVVIEAARNLCGIEEANSTEFGTTSEPVVGLMTEWMKGNELQTRGLNGDLGGTMRLGAWACKLEPGSLAAKAYGQTEISERHRHRYEFSNEYREVLTAGGMDLAAVVDPDHQLGSVRRAGRGRRRVDPDVVGDVIDVRAAPGPGGGLGLPPPPGAQARHLQRGRGEVVGRLGSLHGQQGNIERAQAIERDGVVPDRPVD